MVQLLFWAVALLPFAVAVPSKRAGPSVQLPSGATVVGSTSNNVDSFKGIPYAQPPVGQLRLKPPQPITNTGTIDGTGSPRSCPQFFLSADTKSLPSQVLNLLLNSPLGQQITNAGEDCLTVNVQRPSTATPSSKLPVVFWMFGGGFEFGSTSTYDGSNLVSKSVSQGKDIIYASVNYRTGGFGFMPGKEVLADGSTNLGLRDQRLALQWIADNIEAFGGDPSKVTLWGESAGSISVFDQMALFGGNYTYKGKPLFRGGIMDSGSITPADPIDSARPQEVYDTVVANAGCSGAPDTLQCLRDVDYNTFETAATSVPGIFSFQGIALSYVPRPDNDTLIKSPEFIALEGSYAPVPFIIGDQEDEGTLFSLVQNNITNESELVDYLNTVVFPQVPRSVIQGLVDTYPDDPSAGSPFRTGPLNNVYPEYKRLAAMQGDFVFTLARRIFLLLANNGKPNVPNWSYLGSYFYGTPILGTFHATDIIPAYGIIPSSTSDSIQSYYLSFINTLDPNQGTSLTLPQWPQWSNGQRLMNFGASTNTLMNDDFRNNSASYLISTAGQLRI